MDIAQIKKAINEVFQEKLEVLTVYLYGSFLKTKFYNDIDIGILINEDFKREVFYEAKIAREIEKLINFEIDLRVLNDMPLRLLFNLLLNSKLLCSRDEQKRIDFEERVMKEYLDLKYHHDLYEEMRGLKYVVG